MKNYNQKTIELLTDCLKATEGNVERFNQFSFKKNDLFGIIDRIALIEGFRVCGIQSTGIGQKKKHLDLILSHENTIKWLKRADLFLVCWRKVKVKRGGKAFTYMPDITLFFINQDGVLDYSQFVEWEENWEFYLEEKKKLARDERAKKRNQLIEI
jgi:hypothetical protein